MACFTTKRHDVEGDTRVGENGCPCFGGKKPRRVDRCSIVTRVDLLVLFAN